MKTFIIFLSLFGTLLLQAQPELKLKPDKIEFEDVFSRLEHVLFINKGDENLVIDTIDYNSEFYYIRFDQQYEYPLVIPPNDTLVMDCLLANYFLITSQDTTDTMKIYYSNYTQTEDLKIKIEIFDDDDKTGIVHGVVSDSNGTLSDAKIYFYYDGAYLFDTIRTAADGSFSKNLPEGEYLIAAEKAGYYYNFYKDHFDSYDADEIKVEKDSTVEVNFTMTPRLVAANAVAGKVIDFVSGAAVKKGIIVVRKGKHTPTKLSPRAAMLTDSVESYTGIINSDGTFIINDIINPGYYYVQAFSDFYLPAYISTSNEPAIFWQQTDSVFIQNTVENQTILLKRDSSYGGGIITGSISFNSDTSSVNNLSDVILFAKNVDYNELIYYSIPKKDGTFEINRLPYGRYQLIAQSIGLEDAVSSEIYEISATVTVHDSANLNFTLTSVTQNQKVPDEFKLFGNYPNPFNPTTTIKYSIPNGETQNFTLVQLKVYDILGREIATLVNEKQEPGNHSVVFNAQNLPSGVYLYQLRASGLVQTKKMILLR